MRRSSVVSSIKRPTRSWDFTPMTSCSWANCGPSSGPPPMHTASTVRPCDSMSRLAHCRASRRGSRSGKLARQIVPKRIRCVRAAMADSVTSASARGFDSRLSPTQMPSKYPDTSAVWAAVSRSSSVPHPKRTARVDRLSPNFARIGGRIEIPPETVRFWLLVLVTDVFLMRLSPCVPLTDLDCKGYLERPDVLHRFDDPRTQFIHCVFRDLEEQLVV